MMLPSLRDGRNLSYGRRGNLVGFERTVSTIPPLLFNLVKIIRISNNLSDGIASSLSLLAMTRLGLWDCRRAKALLNDAVGGVPWSHHSLTGIELVKYESN